MFINEIFGNDFLQVMRTRYTRLEIAVDKLKSK